MENHDSPEQGIFDAAVLPGKAELPVIGDEGDDKKSDDWDGHEPWEEPQPQAETADELYHADNIGPEQRVIESDTIEEIGGRLRIPEQNRKSINVERAARHDSDQWLSDRPKGPIDAAKRRNQEARRVHDAPRSECSWRNAPRSSTRVAYHILFDGAEDRLPLCTAHFDANLIAECKER